MHEWYDLGFRTRIQTVRVDYPLHFESIGYNKWESALRNDFAVWLYENLIGLQKSRDGAVKCCDSSCGCNGVLLHFRIFQINLLPDYRSDHVISWRYQLAFAQPRSESGTPTYCD